MKKVGHKRTEMEEKGNGEETKRERPKRTKQRKKRTQENEVQEVDTREWGNGRCGRKKTSNQDNKVGDEGNI